MCRNIFMISWALALLLGAGLEAHGQRRLSQMPKAEREALLVKWAKEEQKTSPYLKDKEWQLEIDSVHIREDIWLPEDPRESPALYYVVDLYNKDAYKKFLYEWLFVFSVFISDETGATTSLMNGNGYVSEPEQKPRYSVPKQKEQKDSREDRKKILD
ncbi:hypothetical protein [Porphyromonas sp. COT-239 OH1446]|uniref:hypothetical protein n=1 Tax=Porphyromonas sp. COT-239 OH1446 TaxID=1515613 RepID=UPI00052BB45E|nr:hypothetical protein [Porphyromonas sp. COT-239 OH1446]KGN70296.1 hypothetical protein HQ37_04480 [Porphyromonas sp. COT-239 OH1446]